MTADHDAATLQRECNAFNAKAPIGTAVCYRQDDGYAKLTRTQTAAKTMPGPLAVVWVKDVAGPVALERIAIMPPGDDEEYVAVE